MIRWFTTQLPEWAQPEHPILKYELSRLQQFGTWRTRFLQFLVVAVVLGIGGYVYANYIYQSSARGNITDLAWRTIYYPTLMIQVIVWIVALSLGVNSVGQERRKQTWDNLRATEVGAALTLRTRWVAILYRLRGAILAILLVRGVLLIGILYDLTAFRGGYLDMLTANITPEMPAWIGVILLAIIMTVSLLLPITMIGFSAAVGVLLSVMMKNRTYVGTAQVIFTTIQIFAVIALLVGVSQFFQGTLEIPNSSALALVSGYSAFGDWGLLLMQLGSAGEIWLILPYGIFIGLGLLVLMLFQALLTDGLLGMAVRLSESRE